MTLKRDREFPTPLYRIPVSNVSPRCRVTALSGLPSCSMSGMLKNAKRGENNVLMFNFKLIGLRQGWFSKVARDTRICTGWLCDLLAERLED
jgi:hypothetical protein